MEEGGWITNLKLCTCPQRKPNIDLATEIVKSAKIAE